MTGQVELFPEKFPWEETVPILVCRQDTEGRRDGVLVKMETEVCNVPKKKVPVDLHLATGGLGACLLPAVTCSPPVSTEKNRQCRGPATHSRLTTNNLRRQTFHKHQHKASKPLRGTQICVLN